MFGLIEKHTPDDERIPSNAKVFIVQDRTTPTLSRIIEKHCSAGTTIFHDGWAAYNRIDYNALRMHH